MKKFRGKKRYFRNLRKKTNAEEYDLDFGNEGWFDFWHTHLDFHGFGNKSLKIRREHIKAHITLYGNLLNNLHTLGKPFQSWIEIIEEEAGLDAIYIHTSNPNENNFPYKNEMLNWNCEIPKYLRDLINPNEFNVGHYKWDSNNCYLIQSKRNMVDL